MSPLIGIVRNWSLLACAQVASSVFALAVMILVSRRLGDAEFGRLFIALTFTTLVGVLVDLGLSQLVVRAVSRDRALARPYLRRGAVLVGVLGATLYTLLLVVLRVLGYAPEVWSLVLIVGLLMIVEGIAQLLGALFQAHERMVVPALTRLGANLITLAVV